MKYIDDILNRITMYRLVVYYLAGLLILAGILGGFGILSISPVALVFTTGLFLFSSLAANEIFSRAFNAVPGSDSTIITALILALIVSPIVPTNVAGIFFVVFISFWAIASKYILAVGKKHLFNPAAFGVALAAIVVGHGASWWVTGNMALLPLVVVGGLLIVRKIHRFDLVLSFAVFAFATIVATSLAHPLTSVVSALTHSTFFFLAFVMLTEPATMPPSRGLRIAYGAIAGVLFAPMVHLGSFYFTPELALLVANIFTFSVSPKGRHVLTLVERTTIATNTYEFVFSADRPLVFRAGQYVEWTLPGKTSDRRGNRRYFTIASAPSEKQIRLGVKFYEPMSTFKQELLELRPGSRIDVAQLAGDFVLPKNTNQKLAFIAGGIGITPFRSMVGEMLIAKEKRDAVLLYSNKTPQDIAYRKVFDTAATALGMKTVYTGLIDTALLTREIPDYRERMFYISGPRSMVLAFKNALADLGVQSSKIKTDYFPGFA